jgi:methyl-accepting chemotaxis protein
MGGTIILGGLALVFALWTTLMSVVRPLSAITRIMQQLAKGDYSVTVPGLGRKDEMGEMAGTVQIFKDNGMEMEQLGADQERSREHAEAEKRRSMNELAASFEAKVGHLVQSLSAAATEMEATAQTMTATADQTTSQSVSVASAAEQTSANVQTVAVTTEELSSSIREIAEQVAKSPSIAGRAAKEAKQTDGTVQPSPPRRRRSATWWP